MQASTPRLTVTLTSLGNTRSRIGSRDINRNIQLVNEQQDSLLTECGTHDHATLTSTTQEEHDKRSQRKRNKNKKGEKERARTKANNPSEKHHAPLPHHQTAITHAQEEHDERSGRTRNKNKKGKKERAKTKANSPSKKKEKKLRTKLNKTPRNLPIRNDCYYGMANHRADTEERTKCIMHFGCTSSSRTLWPGRETKRLCAVSKGGLLSRQIVSGYVSNKIKKAGAKKAARKTLNLDRLQKKYNPIPAIPTQHAVQRYKERGSASSPIYIPTENRNEVIVVTYLPIRRELYSEAKNSRRTFQREVDRMSQLSKKSGDLPRYKLSSRDEYLFKLSSQAVKKEEHRRRSNQKKRAYAKRHSCSHLPHENWTPRSRNTKASQPLHTRSQKELREKKVSCLSRRNLRARRLHRAVAN